MIPQTRYALSGDIHIAYQVVGTHPVDLLLVPGWVSHVEHQWEDPGHAYFLHRLASFARLIVLDKRGTGLSDRVPAMPCLEQRMDDVRAVLDAVGSRRAILFGYSEGGTLCQVFAASHPERTAGLITYGCWPKRLQSDDYPWAPSMSERLQFFEQVRSRWGGAVDIGRLAPSSAGDPQFSDWFASYLRRSASPGAALALAQMNTQIDVRPILGTIQARTLVINRTADAESAIEGARYLAAQIPGAQLLELPGADHLPWVGAVEEVLRAIESFVSHHSQAPSSAARLATVLCIDAFNSRATLLPHWQSALQVHHGEAIEAGHADLRAMFDGPARAIHCACALQEHAALAGISVRIALHAGQVIREHSGWAGPALKVAEQVLASCRPNEVVVTNTLKNLVVGSGLQFGDGRVAAPAGGPALFSVQPDSVEPSRRSRARGRASGLRALTARQRTILELIAQGLSNKEMANLLHLSEHTVHRHLANILNRLGVATRAAAVARMRSGS